MRGCRSTSMSPRSSATASRRWRRRAAALFISQSGETADTLAALRYCARKASTSAACSTCRNRPSRAKADVVFPTLAGPEIGVASTKAFTCQLTVLAPRSRSRRRARGVLTPEEEAELVRASPRLPRLMPPGAELEEPDREGRARSG
jgi:glucosamine--fructose-6-phosphate aminotransferase (isomerizing)